MTSYTSEPLFPGVSFQFSLLQLVLLPECCLCVLLRSVPQIVCGWTSLQNGCSADCALVSSHKMCDKFPHFREGDEHVNFPSTIYHFHSLLWVKTKTEETKKLYRFLYLYYRTFSKSVVWILHCWKHLFQLTFCFPLQYEWEFKTKFWMNSVKCCISMCDNYIIPGRYAWFGLVGMKSMIYLQITVRLQTNY